MIAIHQRIIPARRNGGRTFDGFAVNSFVFSSAVDAELSGIFARRRSRQPAGGPATMHDVWADR